MEIYELTFSVAEVYTVMKAKTLVVVECCVLMLMGSL
jgi:hypothetical protein